MTATLLCFGEAEKGRFIYWFKRKKQPERNFDPVAFLWFIPFGLFWAERFFLGDLVSVSVFLPPCQLQLRELLAQPVFSVVDQAGASVFPRTE